MTDKKLSVLVVGATGSIGQLAVAEALRQGHSVRALARNSQKARKLPAQASAVIGDLTHPDTLAAAVEGVDAIVFAHGSDGGGKLGAEAVDYGGVRNVLATLGSRLGSRTPRIALMTAIGVTNRAAPYNRSTESCDWKRRGERLVRSSGLPYTIVRPGWFDYNKPDEHHLAFLQGDTRRAGNSSDGVIAEPDRRSSDPQPHFRPGTAQDLRTRRHERPGAKKYECTLRRTRPGPSERLRWRS